MSMEFPCASVERRGSPSVSMNLGIVQVVPSSFGAREGCTGADRAG